MENTPKEELKWPLGFILMIYVLIFIFYNHFCK